MATTTYLAFWVLVTRRIDMRIDGHDTFVSETSTTIADMRTDIAVLRKSVENIEADGKETKTSIAEINRTLRDRLTGR
jgi:septal ring factor EnvC (AmiA/AmiB activator)